MVQRLKRVKKSTWIRLAVGISLLCSVFYFSLFSNLREMVTLQHVINWVEYARHSNWSRLVFYCCFILAVLGLPITLFPIIGGVIFEFWVAFPLNVLAVTLGAWLSFSLARFFGREAVEYFLKGKMKSFDRLAAAQGFKAVLVLRLLGVPPFIIANYVLGLSAVRKRHFLLGTMLGVAPWMGLITFAAGSLWEAILVGGEKGFVAALFKTMGPLMVLSFGIIATTLLIFLLKKRSRDRRDVPPSGKVAVSHPR